MKEEYIGTTRYYSDGRVANEEYKKQASECIIATIKKAEGKILTLLDSQYLHELPENETLVKVKKEVKSEFNLLLAYASGYFAQLPYRDTSETTREAPSDRMKI